MLARLGQEVTDRHFAYELASTLVSEAVRLARL
jgi:hypothetical protein